MLNWCGHLHIYEEDKPKEHDLIRYEKFCTTDVIKRFHYSDIKLHGDMSPTYEVKYQLHHNCTPDVFWRCLIPEEAVEVPVNGEWNKNEILGEEEFCGVPEGVKEVNFDFSEKGYLSRGFKINYQLTHNCTIDDLTRCIRPDYFTQFDPRIL
ncbi:hypothetical protein GCK72_015813 [Caenorhabditis remanei]|uniref:Uncharacterized protein n=1 Tax=Caenorhabditis remanei TaxID=31234 RepID=A0A6A5GV50_CAERE|nr:hypothetical protein GCK72_015813 [Caenorhabditis remanei]KAF1759348.1 hypothetical protein GCK72_015813 [Caenorhabditis remanei]